MISDTAISDGLHEYNRLQTVLRWEREMANGQTPAGWYPDPAGDTSLIRYWDGHAWTAQTQPMVQPGQLSGIGAPPVTPQPVYAPGQAIPYSLTSQPVNDRKGFAIAGFVLGIVSVALFCFTWIDAALALLAIIFSAIGIKSSRKKLAIVGLILGIVGLIVSVVYGLVVIDMIADPTKYGLPANFFEQFGL